MQINLYSVILVAISINSQSSDGMRQINLALGPASAYFNSDPLDNSISGETDTNELSNYLVDSDELIRTKINPTTWVPDVDVEPLNISPYMGPNNLVVPPVTTKFSTLTTSRSTNTDHAISETAATTITPPILANNSSPITPSFADIYSRSTTALPSSVSTIMETAEVIVTNNSTPISSVVTESNTLVITPSSTTMEDTITPRRRHVIEIQATSTSEPPISVARSTPTLATTSHPISIITSSQSTAILSTSTTRSSQSSATVTPNLCGENEVYSCLPLCPRTCNDPLSSLFCIPIPTNVSFCRRGCTCIRGYLLEKTTGKCVKDCPVARPL